MYIQKEHYHPLAEGTFTAQARTLDLLLETLEDLTYTRGFADTSSRLNGDSVAAHNAAWAVSADIHRLKMRIARAAGDLFARTIEVTS